MEVNYPNGIKKRKQIKETKKENNVTYGNRGMNLENLVLDTSDYYKELGIAIISKNDPGKSFSRNNADMIYTKKGIVDFSGCKQGGQAVFFDCKETKTTNLPYKNIKEHQLIFLKEVFDMGCEDSFLLVSFTKFNRYFKVPIDKIYKYKEENPSKQSFSLDFFENDCIEVFEDFDRNNRKMILKYLK